MVLIDKDGSILGCHGTGKPKDSGYDFPKGCVDDGETHFEAALRELHEETNLTLDKLVDNGFIASDHITDLGVYRHNSTKNIHIYVCPVKNIPFDELSCNSFFERNGKQYPEVDGYRMIGKDERFMFNKVLWDKFCVIDESMGKIEF